MATLIIEHLDARDLPDEWARPLAVDGAQKVTVRIDTEASATAPGCDPAFGMWADHPASVDVTAFVDGLRCPRSPDVPAEGEPSK